ncbi:RIBULOSE-phosphate 3-epimerase [Savitreella phatthalungensis]
MDGHFVPNLSFFDVAMIREHLPKSTGKVLDLHMMVSNPEKWVDLMSDNGADSYTFHVEAVASDAHAIELIKAIHAKGMKVAAALKPSTPASAVAAYADMLDMILVMTVEPGFGGQKFMEDMMPKVQELRKRYPSKLIQVDGGLSEKTIDKAADAGANVIVAGTGIFKAADTRRAIDGLRSTVIAAQQAAARM